MKQKSSNNKALQQLAEQINRAIDYKLEKARFDKSYIAQVVSKEENHRYIVAFNGQRVNAKGYPSADFNLGDFVTITIPQNNISNTFIIPKTGSYLDPTDSQRGHIHSNKTVLDRITNKMVDDMNALRALAFKDKVSQSDLDELLAQAISSIEDKVSQEAMETALRGKVDIEAGKGLSTNDFTDDYKDKIDSMADPVQADWAQEDEEDPSYIKNKPAIPVYVDDLVDGQTVLRNSKVYVLRGGSAASYLN